MEDTQLHAAILECYGVRARLVDLQTIRSSGSRSIEIIRQIEECSRRVDQADQALFRMIENNPELGWRAWEMIKETRNGSIQRLSQRLKTLLPSRDDERPVVSMGDFHHGFKTLRVLLGSGAAVALMLVVFVVDQKSVDATVAHSREAKNSLLAIHHRH